uniref:Uncharacterized protein n=1 Tax=uncultured bacterium Contig643 TaxID=1393602 RepID=W0FH95_9BACT|nr:hypothetical protein [uncultured bacterium Contig643]
MKHETAKNVQEAWRIADRIFPTDYMKDEEASERAGYPIYRSTAAERNDWISDLGVRLEINIDAPVETITIWIEQEPEIEETSKMDSDDVRSCCIRNELYTCGTVSEYNAMLNMVRDEEYSTKLLYRVARDIKEHSDNQTITNVMYLLRKEAVRTFYEIKE